jgi:hypothetical protein
MKLPLFALGVFAAVAAISGQTKAQNYPWCSNFADGAGTNCGWTSLEQCMITVTGSGGYCDHNNLYKLPAGEAAVPAPRKPHKINSRHQS